MTGANGPALTCPDCGESEELRGTRSGDLIHIRCERCGAEWTRDTRVRCATCGGDAIVVWPRAVTQHARGTQVSYVGWQDVPLCQRCDAVALERSTSSGAPIPPDYEPAAMQRRGSPEGDKP